LTEKVVVGVSRTILMHILTDMRVLLGESETEQLYKELLAHFGLVGASDVCQALETAWKDPYNKQEIEARQKRNKNH